MNLSIKKQDVNTRYYSLIMRLGLTTKLSNLLIEIMSRKLQSITDLKGKCFSPKIKPSKMLLYKYGHYMLKLYAGCVPIKCLQKGIFFSILFVDSFYFTFNVNVQN